MPFLQNSRLSLRKLLFGFGVFAIAASPLVGVTGCGTANTGAEVTRNRLYGTVQRPVRPIAPPAVRDRTPGPVARAPIVTNDANHVAMLARSVPGVEASVAFVIDQTAYVGLQVNRRYTPVQRTRVEQVVRQRIFSGTVGLRNVRTTTDLGVISQMNHFSRQIANGRPIASFTNAITRLFAPVSPNRPLR